MGQMNLSPLIRQRFFDVNGLPLAGGQLFSYQAGTTTPQVTYSNETGTTNSNPVVLDAYGYCDVWLDPTLAYKFILEDVNSVVQWTTDNIAYPIGLTTWSANTTYSQGAIAADSSGQGLLYVSLINNNQNQALTSTSAWRMFDGNTRTVSTSSSLLVTDNFIRSNSTSGNLTHTLPPCSTTPIGKQITIKDVGTGGNATTVQGSGTDLVDGFNVYATTLTQYNSAPFTNNGSSWDVGSTIVPKGSITQSKLAARATGTTVAAGGVAVSASSGGFSTTSGSNVQITNLSVTITTTGRPVFVGLIGQPGQQGFIQSDAQGTVSLFNSNTGLALAAYPAADVTTGTGLSTVGVVIPASSVWTLDMTVNGTPGTYTYNAKALTPSGIIYVNDAMLVAYEI
jgi:hypothetical protein